LAAAYPYLERIDTAAPQRADSLALPDSSVSSTASIRIQSESALTRSQAHMYAILTCIWVAANVLFWVWWLQPERIGLPWLYVLMTIALAYDATVLPTAYLFYVGRMRHARHFRAEPGLRVALVTLCVPAQESLDVIGAQLEALVRVRYPHDSWVLDEGNDPAVRSLATRLGVEYFSRAGIDRYNQAQPPFKAKTKAGNVNAWLDAHGSTYDFFVQLDIDHRPRPEYLDRVLGYFRDRQVGWVQAPSLYGNLDNWVARGAAEQELVLQGPLQRGFFGHTETPFIIGSHCTYRMSAIREIGGFQPTRAEDHLDSVMLAAHGYRGVYVPEVIALGLGPDSFETYLRQQFAWAVSMIQVLGTYTPRLIGQFRLRQAIQFLFAETWYPLFGLSMLILFMTPLVALLVGQAAAQTSLLHFVVASAPLQLTCLLIWWWTRRWQLPLGLRLSWRGVVLHIARWPIVLWALINVLLRVRHPYMITPKTVRNGLPVLAVRSLAIYLVGFAVSLGVVWMSLTSGVANSVAGYLVFAMLGACYMLLVVVVNVALDLAALHRLGAAWYQSVGLRVVPLCVVSGLVLALGVSALASAPRVIAAAGWERISQPANETSTAIVADLLPIMASEQSTAVASGQAALTVDSLDAVPELTIATNRQPMLSADRLSVGAFDPWRRLDALPLVLEHSYVPQSEPRLLAASLAHAGDRRIPLVTLEPLSLESEAVPVLDRIVSGQADGELAKLARVVRDSAPQTVLIRWAHEMDLNLLYPWSSNDPALYRAAFRHVVEVFRAEGVSNARWVWSPAGQGNALAFYPGDDVVDYVGLTVLGDASWDAELGYASRQSMADILRPRYSAVQSTLKPIIIAELAVSGSAAEQAAWLDDGARALTEFPRVAAVVYFNDRNAPNNWRGTQPDWRLDDARALDALLPDTAEAPD
jgi:cellulose synthase (UDP-forming)